MIKLKVDIPLKKFDRESLKRAIRIYETVVVEKKYYLRGKELEFFVSLVIYHQTNSKESYLIDNLKNEKGGVGENGVYLYLKKLRDKMWIKKEGNDYHIPKFLINFPDLNIDLNINYA